MNILKGISAILSQLKALDRETKKHLAIISGILFFVFLSYPMIRSTVDAIFLNSFGAKKSPFVWIYSVIVITIVVSIYNKLHSIIKSHHLFIGTALGTVAIMFAGVFLIETHSSIWAYPLYVWKEAYIVLLVHTTFALLNSTVSFDTAKLIYGPVGGVVSFGGIIGGLLTSKLSYSFSTEQILQAGALMLIVSSALFYLLSRGNIDQRFEKREDKHREESPLSAISNVYKYVFLVGAVIALSQFVINMANFKFFLLLEQFATDKISKTRYMGTIYSSINTVSLIFQLLFIPVILKFFKNRSLHYFIPLLFIVVTIFGFFLGGSFLLPVAASFVAFKGIDYSLFSTAKELLYFPLNSRQKFGAKYINDMVIYRLAKGVISFLMTLQVVVIAINYFLIGFLVLWILVLIPLFRELKRLTDNQPRSTP